MQDFGNAYSTFVAQNFGAEHIGAHPRGHAAGVPAQRGASALRCLGARVRVRRAADAAVRRMPGETAVVAAGVRYLRIEGAFYAGIGCLFLLYGYFRAVQRAGDVGGADGDLAGNARGVGLCVGGRC